jgi:hypothetical protein
MDVSDMMSQRTRTSKVHSFENVLVHEYEVCLALT